MAKLSECIYILYPDFMSFDGTKSQMKEHFYKAIEYAWVDR
jgi:hypothetical protein